MAVSNVVVRRAGAAVLTTALVAALLAWLPASSSAQSTLERGPNLDGPWVTGSGVLQFNVMHRFWVTPPPARKVFNTPTVLLGAGVGRDVFLGARYASNSRLVSGEFNEWELFARWAPLASPGAVASAVTASWSPVAGSVDGEVVAARTVGPVRAQLSGRAFSAFRGADPDVALGAGAVWSLTRHVAVAADVVSVLSAEVDPAWSAGLQLRIPTTPHTLSLHVSNAFATTLQGSSFDGDDRFWGFEFTVPLTLSRFFGGGSTPAMGSGGHRGAEDVEAGGAAGPPPSDTAVVTMDNRLRFLPDTIRVVAGAAVRWENTSDVIHTVTADPARAVEAANVSLPAEASPFDSGDLRPGEVFVRVFDVPGTYRYVCVPHELAGMVGTVIVEQAAGGG
ncbi:MAG: plastocyanin/azurin family copper-binding protein [Gemmatimonadota bacterium]